MKMSRRRAVGIAGKGLCVAAGAAVMGKTVEAGPSTASAPTKGKPGEPAPKTTPNAEAAEAMFKQGYNCAQAVLTCCGSSYKLPRETGIRMGQAFVGGMGMMGLTCGSVTGAFMVIGLKHAQLETKDTISAGQANRVVREFSRRWKALHGSLCCSELLGHDISTQEGLQACVSEELFKKKCPVLVRDAAALAEELLAAETKEA